MNIPVMWQREEGTVDVFETSVGRRWRQELRMD